MEETLHWLGSRWTYKILKLIDQKTICKFSDFIKLFPEINHTLLSERLQTGVELGILYRVKKDKNKIEYGLNPKYYSLIPDLHNVLMITYSDKNE